jgi:predicted RNA binding protein YcfA (HicA-like mRNA interferase family)
VRLPRDISGSQLAQALGTLGYAVKRQTGSHMRLTTEQNGVHHITVPAHSPIRVGTLASILDEVAGHFEITRAELIDQLFG